MRGAPDATLFDAAADPFAAAFCWGTRNPRISRWRRGEGARRRNAEMADLERTKENAESQLWDMLGSVQAGMLGLDGAPMKMQPMSHYIDRENKKLWFFTKKDSELVQELGSGRPAHYCLIGQDHDYHATLSGYLQENCDPEQVDRMWNAVVGAWFDGGKDDPALTLLELDLEDAMVWASLANPIVFGWEIAKARADRSEPDVGVRTAVNF
jgi:general stress protein 26